VGRDFLIQLRGKKTRAEVAKIIGVTPQALGMIERGERTPRPTLMQKMADYYGATVQELFFITEKDKTCQNTVSDKRVAG
jgi:putative transcriptional regulator